MSGDAAGDAAGGARRRMPHALVMMLLIIAAAVALTWVVPAGRFERTKNGLVVPGSFRRVPKRYDGALAGPRRSADSVAYPASPVAVVSSIPAGMVRTAPLVVMILFIGGMFGVLQATGALAAGIERLLAVTRGDVFVLAPLLMVVIAAGSTFLGLISEYLVLIPIMVLLAERLGLDALFGTALVTIAAKIGYLTSVTNPLALVVAQPIVGVPVFSGAGVRAATFVLMLPIGIAYLLRYAKRRGAVRRPALDLSAAPLAGRHVAVLLVLVAAIGAMVYGVEALDWGNPELAAVYLAVALVMSAVGGLDSRAAAQSFLHGTQVMVLPALLVGLAAAVEIVLRDAQVLDTIIAFLARSVEGKPPVVVAQLMVFVQMLIDVFIPSTSGKAAVTMPILGPIGRLAGVSGQVTVQAFLFGNGLTNTVTPTSGMLLAYLATGKVSYGAWIRFIMPLVLVLTVLCLVAISIMVVAGY